MVKGLGPWPRSAFATLLGLLSACSSGGSTTMPSAARKFDTRVPFKTNYRVVYSFGRGDDSANPIGSLLNVNGTFYGAARGGQFGSIFSVTPGGTENVLYRFNARPSLANCDPNGGIIEMNGALLGTTTGCSRLFVGNIFKLTLSGIETRRFVPGASLAGLLNVGGTLYGTTAGIDSRPDRGTIFATGLTGRLNVIHYFPNSGTGQDGRGPSAPLIDVDSTLYGTTAGGGAYASSVYRSGGTVFRLNPNGKEEVVHSFGKGADGSYPLAPLVLVNGTLYGTTEDGGAYNRGAVFSIASTGKYEVLHSFGQGTDGRNPASGLTPVNGILYGTTLKGGSAGRCGVVFDITRTGTEEALHAFQGTDGCHPAGGVIEVNGTLYGTAADGGAHNKGVIFALTP